MMLDFGSGFVNAGWFLWISYWEMQWLVNSQLSVVVL